MSDYTQQIKRDWSSAPYYELAEKSLSPFWSEGPPFIRLFNTLDLTNVVELACGHGRHAEYMRRNYPIGHITLVDVNISNIDFCQRRFLDDNRISYLINSGSDLQDLASEAYTSLFCYDAMVHFEYDDVFNYLKEFHRILRPNGRALLHHSNYDKEPGARYSDNPAWRNFMSAALFAHAAMRIGFRVVEQHLIDWAGMPRLDCATLLARPNG
jgi:ubiquinone/menaquinone biosynthesis C-methylase UbiE